MVSWSLVKKNGRDSRSRETEVGEKIAVTSNINLNLVAKDISQFSNAAAAYAPRRRHRRHRKAQHNAQRQIHLDCVQKIMENLMEYLCKLGREWPIVLSSQSFINIVWSWKKLTIGQLPKQILIFLGCLPKIKFLRGFKRFCSKQNWHCGIDWTLSYSSKVFT